MSQRQWVVSWLSYHGSREDNRDRGAWLTIGFKECLKAQCYHRAPIPAATCVLIPFGSDWIMLIQSDCDPTSLSRASLSSRCVWGVNRKLLWAQAAVRLLYPHLKRVPVKSFNTCFHPFLSRRAAILLPPLQPGLRWPLQPAGSLADPRRGEEVPVRRLLSHLQPHVVAAETQLLRVLLTHGMRTIEGDRGTRSELRVVEG